MNNIKLWEDFFGGQLTVEFMRQQQDIEDREIKIERTSGLSSNFIISFELPSVINTGKYLYDFGKQKIKTSVNTRSTMWGIHNSTECIPIEYTGSHHPHVVGLRWNDYKNEYYYGMCMGNDYIANINRKNILCAYLIAESVLNNKGHDGVALHRSVDFGGICKRCGGKFKSKEISEERICNLCERYIDDL